MEDQIDIRDLAIISQAEIDVMPISQYQPIYANAYELCICCGYWDSKLKIWESIRLYRAFGIITYTIQYKMYINYTLYIALQWSMKNACA